MTTSATDPLVYYCQHSLMSDPGPQRSLFDDLPTDLAALHQIVQNVLIHVWKIRKFNPHLLEGRTTEIESRRMPELLTYIRNHDNRPLTEPRLLEQKLIVDCRHFAGLLCAMLRHHGIPARTRSGFATYLETSHYQEHWICEYWNGERWVKEDPDLVMHDIPRDQFRVAGQAWQTCRAGQDDPDKYGYGGDASVRGWWAIRNNVVRDVAALNKVEEMSLAGWGLVRGAEAVTDPAVLNVLDRTAVATLTDNASFATLRDFYLNTPEVRAPDDVELYNYVTDKVVKVNINPAVA